jgi:rhodanese-related sulfurtransferase
MVNRNLSTEQQTPTFQPHLQLPYKKQTSLGLYLTAKEAYQMWKANPKRIHILDVRTPEEFVFVGHPEMARSLPILFVKHQWDSAKNELAVEPNPDFIPSVKSLFAPTDTILVMCRSGGRSAVAVNQLAKAGFLNVYNIYDGMEGDKVDEVGSIQHGKRTKNGWKNSGSPWTYEVNPELLTFS